MPTTLKSEVTIDDVPEMLKSAVRLHRAGQPQQAEKLYRRVLRVLPGEPDALHLWGLSRFHSGGFEKAIDLIGRALAAKPRCAVYHNSLAHCYAAQNQSDQAIHHYRVAIDLEPMYQLAAQNLLALLRRLGRLDEAAEYERRVAQPSSSSTNKAVNHTSTRSSFSSALDEIMHELGSQ